MPIIEQIYFLPPMAIARLGGSSIPSESFTWTEDPSLASGARTVITPSVTLEVEPDGSVIPYLPSVIHFRDAELLRPVAPFLELWAQVDGQEQLAPLNISLLEQNGCSPESVVYTVVATNRKAARRAGDDACAYSARIEVPGNSHEPRPLRAYSLGNQPLVSPDRPIPLGQFQVIRPTAGVKVMGVDLSALRVRFTPATGEVYGPPNITVAADPETSRVYEMVPAQNRILNPNSTWLSYNSDDSHYNNPEPSDTYDGADYSDSGIDPSFGVVDDTCDVVIRAVLVVGGVRKEASARVFSGPPDFAPDRRPFVSLADELANRDLPVEVFDETLPDALDRLGDLFQRAYETASLANVDAMRTRSIGGQRAAQVAGLPKTNFESMTPKDSPYFDKDQDLNSASTTGEELPYASVAHDVHGPLADTDDLALFLRTSAAQVRRLIRPPYGAFQELAPNPAPEAKPNPKHRDPRIVRDTLHDMRMPPYMRDSDATALSLTRRQYKFIMQMVDKVGAPKAGRAAPQAIPTRVQEHLRRVVGRRAAAEAPPAQSQPDAQQPVARTRRRKPKSSPR